MQIEVVTSGDSLYAIAQRYGVTVESIATLNVITDPSRLVVGQALLIPTESKRYTVRPGDTLWLIARRLNVSVQSIIDLNGITNPSMIAPGTVLLVPSGPKPLIESNGYLQPSTPAADRRKVAEAGDALTYVAIFSYRAQRDGSLIAPDDAAALEAIGGSRAVPMLTVTNFEKGTFSAEVARAIFDSADVRQTLIDNIIETMTTKGYTILNVDFEHVFPDDRERYNAFLRELRDRLHARNLRLSTALAPKASATQVGQWYEAHDYPAHGEIADFVVLMTYEWGWSGGPPMAVAPIGPVRRVLDYALSVMPPDKIMMGIPLYGYDWTLPYVPGGEFARSLGLNEAVQQAARVNAAIDYDLVSQAPNYSYYDADGKQHVVWFEDVRSLQAKYDLVKQLGLRGVSYWVLGKPYPQNWALLQDNFTIRSYKS